MLECISNVLFTLKGFEGCPHIQQYVNSIDYTAYFFFCDTESNWISSVQGCLRGHRAGVVRSHQFLWTMRRLEMHPLCFDSGKVTQLPPADPLPGEIWHTWPGQGPNSASGVTAKSSTALPVHPSRTVTLLHSLVWERTTFFFSPGPTL